MNPTYFRAIEKESYSIGNPVGGNIWGRNITFKSPRMWTSQDFETSYSKGCEFIYNGIESWKFHFQYIFDCDILYSNNNSKNYLTVELYKNREVYDKETFIIKPNTQVIKDIYPTVQRGDAFHLRLNQKKLTDIIEFKAEHPNTCEFSAESHY